MDSLLALMQQKRGEIGDVALAESLGVSRSTIRSICTGNYPGDPAKVLKKFGQVYIDVVHCPHADQSLQRDDCNRRSTAPKPFGGTAKLSWWQACQACELSNGGERHV